MTARDNNLSSIYAYKTKTSTQKFTFTKKYSMKQASCWTLQNKKLDFPIRREAALHTRSPNSSRVPGLLLLYWSSMTEFVPTPTLSAILEEWRQVEKKIAEAEGEISIDDERRMDVIDLSLPEKVDATNFIIDSLEARAEYYKNRGKEIHDIGMRYEREAEFRKSRSKRVLIENDKKEILGHDTKLQIVEMKSKLVITDEGSLPGKYFTERTVYDLDKAMLRADIESGEQIVHARLEKVYALRRPLNTHQNLEKKIGKEKRKVVQQQSKLEVGDKSPDWGNMVIDKQGEPGDESQAR